MITEATGTVIRSARQSTSPKAGRRAHGQMLNVVRISGRAHLVATIDGKAAGVMASSNTDRREDNSI